MQIKIKKLHQDARIPAYQSSGAAGFDFCSIEKKIIKAGEWGLVKTGLAFEISEGYELQVRPRSGLALKNGISVLNSPGTIDSDYRGEVGIVLINHSKIDFCVEVGDRIAQGVIARFEQVDFVETEKLLDTQRGTKGFGSSGKN